MQPAAPAPRPLRIEFLMCGSPNDAFYSQAAMFRLALDALGAGYREARLVLCLADHEQQPVPARWRPWLRNIEISWASRETFLLHGDGGDDLFLQVSADADLSIICDADTLLLQPLEDARLRELLAADALGAVIAHYRPAAQDGAGHDYGDQDSQAFWDGLARHVLGRTVPLRHRYALSREPEACPFYANYGVLIAPPRRMRQMREQLDIVQPKIREYLDNAFYGQIGLAMSVERGDIPHIALPLRYNFPNDAVAAARHPDELANLRFVHYLRTQYFDRHRIFASRAAFEEFLNLPLSGCNALLQARVREITGGRYPFA